MNVQQLELKLFLADGAAVDQAKLIPIFHRWIQQGRLGKEVLLIDVADYRHVPHGPGVMIVADGAQWRMDEGDGEVGLAFARKRDPVGPASDKLREAARHLLRAARALEDEPSLAGGARFATDRLRVSVVSRAVASGDADSFGELEPELRAFAGALLPGVEVIIEQVNQPREALAAELRTSGDAPSVAELLARVD